MPEHKKISVAEFNMLHKPNPFGDFFIPFCNYSITPDDNILPIWYDVRITIKPFFYYLFSFFRFIQLLPIYLTEQTALFPDFQKWTNISIWNDESAFYILKALYERK